MNIVELLTVMPLITGAVFTVVGNKGHGVMGAVLAAIAGLVLGLVLTIVSRLIMHATLRIKTNTGNKKHDVMGSVLQWTVGTVLLLGTPVLAAIAGFWLPSILLK